MPPHVFAQHGKKFVADHVAGGLERRQPRKVGTFVELDRGQTRNVQHARLLRVDFPASERDVPALFETGKIFVFVARHDRVKTRPQIRVKFGGVLVHSFTGAPQGPRSSAATCSSGGAIVSTSL